MLGYTNRSICKVLRSHRLVVVKVVDRRLAACGGVSSHLCRLCGYNLVVKVGDTLYLLRLLVTVNVHHVWWGMKGCLLCMMHVDMPIDVLQLDAEVMDLLLQKLNHRLVLTHGGLKCLNFAFKLANPSISITNLLTQVLHLLVSQTDCPLEGLSKVYHLCHSLTLMGLQLIKCIHAPD
jgi:hypothetical protein